MDTVALTGAVEAGAIVPMLASSRHFDLQGLTLWIFSLILIGNPTLSYATSLNQQAKELVLSLELGGATQELGQWSRKELEKNFKHQGNSEQAPDSGKTERWTGILLQNLIDQGLGSLPPEAKAEVDLVILKNGAGVQAFIPRAVITKYPLLVAFQKNRAALKNLQTIVPWNSKPKVLEESLPLSRYFVNGLTRIELANYKEKYGTLLLKRRTDPSAMRGEKLFVQNCVGCHDAGQGPAISEFRNQGRVRSLASTGHPSVKGNPKLSERDQRAVLNYLEAYRQENAFGISQAQTGSTSGTVTR